MLPRVDNSIRPVAAVEAAASVAVIGDAKQITDARQDALLRIAQIGVGKPTQGQILSRLSDGTFFVKVGGATARIALPDNVKVGDSISLTLLSLTPRPLFELDNGLTKTIATAVFTHQEGEEGVVADLSDADQATTVSKAQRYQDALPSRIATTSQEDIPTSTPTTLSNAGKLIDQILQSALQSGKPASILATNPLIQNLEELAHPAQLANSLKQTITSTGVFYESHVAEWSQGKFPLSQLQAEPQSNWAGQTAPNTPLNAEALAANPALAQMVQTQLDTLEQQRLAWQGNLLPNIPMEWQIKRHDEQKSGTDHDEQQDNWQSVLRIDFPELGQITASITMYDKQLVLHLQGASEGTVNLLKIHSSSLAEELQQVGTPLLSLSIKQDGQA